MLSLNKKNDFVRIILYSGHIYVWHIISYVCFWPVPVWRVNNFVSVPFGGGGGEPSNSPAVADFLFLSPNVEPHKTSKVGLQMHRFDWVVSQAGKTFNWIITICTVLAVA